MHGVRFNDILEVSKRTIYWFFRGPLFILKTTTTTNFPQLTILVASVGRFDLLYFLNDWSHGLLLTTFCYDSRSVTREKRTEKKHEKKFKAAFTNTCTIQ